MPDPAFVDRLNEQIGYEFGASQQYVAAAVYYDNETLPRLAAPDATSGPGDDDDLAIEKSHASEHMTRQ